MSSYVQYVAVLIWNAEKIFWGATASTLGFGAARYIFSYNPATLRLGLQMASFGARAHYASLSAILSTPLTTAQGSVTLGGAIVRGGTAIGAGYAIGATAGTIIAGEVWGDEGAEMALDLYMPGGADFVTEGLLGIPSNVSTIVSHYLS